MNGSKVTLIVLCGILIVSFCFGTAAGSSDERGEALFKEHCTACHPGGGNIVNPQKTLHRKDLQANKVRTEEDIVGLMRKPGPGMLAFDRKTISDKDARSIARYILKTFKKE